VPSATPLASGLLPRGLCCLSQVMVRGWQGCVRLHVGGVYQGFHAWTACPGSEFLVFYKIGKIAKLFNF